TDTEGQPTTRPTATEPSSGSTQQTTAETGPAYDWAMSLPRGREAAAAWVANGRVHIGTGWIDIPDLDFGLVGTTPDGLLLNTSVKGVPQSQTLAIARPRGGLRYLPERSGPHQALENLLSPDGTEVAYRSGVLDTSTGDLIAPYPAMAVEMEAWT